MRFLGLMLAVCVFVSCSLQAKMTILPGALGVDADLSLKSQSKEAWKNLQALDSSLPADPFDPALWRRGLGSSAKIATSDTGTSVAFSVSDPQRLFPGLKAQSGTWELTLDRTTVRRLASLSTWGSSPALDSLIPSPEASITEAEYRDLLVYLLGPATPASAAQLLIDGSTVQLTIVAPRPLISAEGAVSFEGNQAVYRWPLLRVLALETPLHLRLTF